MASQWRVILDGAHNAASNMAIDETLLWSCTNLGAPPTLRLYTWNGPAVSLGCMQKIDPSLLDLEFCERAGVQVVRRPTGGRAVLHGHDLTFSIALADTDIRTDSRSVLGSHKWLMSGVSAGLQILGVAAEIGSGGDKQHRPSADCFAHVAQCDLQSGEAKVAGAAQVRKWGGLLQQGSIPVGEPMVDPGLLFRGRRHVDADGVLECISIDRLCSALVQGFCVTLGIELVISALTEQEKEHARVLENAKYSATEWTRRLSTVLVDNDK